MDVMNIGATRWQDNGIRKYGDQRGSDASFAGAMAAAQQSTSSTSSLPARDTVLEVSSSGFALKAIEDGLDAWMAKRRDTAGVSQDFLARINESLDAYRDVLKKADAQGGFEDPQAFLQGLNAQELRAIQHMHNLADPIDVDSLTEEGALNLLLPQTMARDLDGNGLTSVGAAQMMIFPPTNAPQSVKDAWQAAMADVEPGMRMTMELKMWMAAGGALAAAGPQGGARVDYERPDFDYVAALQRAIDGTKEGIKFQDTEAKRAYGEAMVVAFQRVRDQLASSGQNALV